MVQIEMWILSLTFDEAGSYTGSIDGSPLAIAGIVLIAASAIAYCLWYIHVYRQTVHTHAASFDSIVSHGIRTHDAVERTTAGTRRTLTTEVGQRTFALTTFALTHTTVWSTFIYSKDILNDSTKKPTS